MNDFYTVTLEEEVTETEKSIITKDISDSLDLTADNIKKVTHYCLFAGRLCSPDTVQCIINDEICKIHLTGKVRETAGYDVLVYGIREDKAAVCVLEMFDISCGSYPYLLMKDLKIMFLYIDSDKMEALPEKYKLYREYKYDSGSEYTNSDIICLEDIRQKTALNLRLPESEKYDPSGYDVFIITQMEEKQGKNKHVKYFMRGLQLG